MEKLQNIVSKEMYSNMMKDEQKFRLNIQDKCTLFLKCILI